MKERLSRGNREEEEESESMRQLHHINRVWTMSGLRRDGTGRPNLKGANGDKDKLVFPVQLTTRRTGKHSTTRFSLSMKN